MTTLFIGPIVEIVTFEFVAVFAFGFLEIDGRETFTTENILLEGDDFKMIEIDARTIPAKMIELLVCPKKVSMILPKLPM